MTRPGIKHRSLEFSTYKFFQFISRLQPSKSSVSGIPRGMNQKQIQVSNECSTRLLGGDIQLHKGANLFPFQFNTP